MLKRILNNILLLLILTGCKERVMTEKERQAYERTIDSIKVRNMVIDEENRILKARKPIHDTVYKFINKKVKNGFRQVDNFDSIARVRWNDSVTEHLINK